MKVDLILFVKRTLWKMINIKNWRGIHIKYDSAYSVLSVYQIWCFLPQTCNSYHILHQSAGLLLLRFGCQPRTFKSLVWYVTHLSDANSTWANSIYMALDKEIDSKNPQIRNQCLSISLHCTIEYKLDGSVFWFYIRAILRLDSNLQHSSYWQNCFGFIVTG